MTISIVRTGRELVPVNIVGMVICLGGITAHVVRKATQSSGLNKTKTPGHEQYSHRKYAMLSQSSSDSDSDNDLFHDITRPSLTAGKSILSSDKLNAASVQPLLLNENESDFSSDEETFQLCDFKSDNTVIGMNKKRNGDKTWNSVGDEFFLRDNRTWTSVKDAHVQMRYNSFFEDELETQKKAQNEHNNEPLIHTDDSK